MRISPVTFFSQLKNQNLQNRRTVVLKGNMDDYAFDDYDPDDYVPDCDLSDEEFNQRYSLNYCDARMAYERRQASERANNERYITLIPGS